MREINRGMAARGLTLREGTVVDASLVAAPTSTKNRSGERDPEMHRTKKGPVALRDEDARWGGRGDGRGAQPRGDGGERVGRGARAPAAAREGEAGVGRRGMSGRGEAPGEPRRDVEWRVAMRPGARRQLDPASEEARREKASVRAKAEHPFFYVKRMFGYGKVRYRGLHKNRQRIALLLLGFANLLIAERSLAA